MAGLPQPRPSRDQRREKWVGDQVRVDALRLGVEVEQVAAGGEGFAHVVRVGVELCFHAAITGPEPDDAGTVREPQRPAVRAVRRQLLDADDRARSEEREQAGDVKGLAVGEQQPPLCAGTQTGRSRRTSRSTGATRSSRGSPSREATSRSSWTDSARRSPPDPSI